MGGIPPNQCREEGLHRPWTGPRPKICIPKTDPNLGLNQNALGVRSWDKYASLIQGKGEMGKVYPTYKWGVEGDTPSFLHIMPNGLNDPEDPLQVGWGGYHVFGLSPDGETSAWTNWEKPAKDLSDSYGKGFYPDVFNDFAARMEWAEKGEGNTNPVVIVNGKGGYSPVKVSAKAGKTLTLDASRSFGPGGDGLSFRWWVQREAGSYGPAVEITSSTSPKVRVRIPEDDKGKTLHIICEVHDSGPFNLVSYKRLIVSVE